ncbi:MAG TPA: hypothetical protein VFU43_13755 [Streptosporangiaceae bacterium]|nr:hypothetical protein [Streptosporangiaceae bacterium]
MTLTTPPVHRHNSFAIPRHRLPNDTDDVKVKVKWEPDWPLVPWSVHGHDALFALIDDLEQVLERFRAEGPDPDNLTDRLSTSGHLVVVSGEEGAGKTSLIHYCVHDLMTRLGCFDDPPPDAPASPWSEMTLPPGVKVVNVAGERNDDKKLLYRNGKLAGIDEVNLTIYEQVLEILRGGDETFKHISESPERTDDLKSASVEARYGRLSDILMDLRWTIFVIVPNIKWNDRDLTRQFLRSCASFSTPGIVFFVESTNSEMDELVDAEFTESEKRHITHLTIGQLKEFDCEQFITRRLLAAEAYTNHVVVTDDAHLGYRATVDYRCVRKMQLTFYGVAEEVRRNGGVIDMARLRAYQEREQKQAEKEMRQRRKRRRGPS